MLFMPLPSVLLRRKNLSRHGECGRNRLWCVSHYPSAQDLLQNNCSSLLIRKIIGRKRTKAEKMLVFFEAFPSHKKNWSLDANSHISQKHIIFTLIVGKALVTNKERAFSSYTPRCGFQLESFDNLAVQQWVHGEPIFDIAGFRNSWLQVYRLNLRPRPNARWNPNCLNVVHDVWQGEFNKSK